MRDVAQLCGLLALLALLVCSEVRHAWERRAWDAERAALLERLVPGLRLAPVPEPRRTRTFGTDADEWKVQRARELAARQDDTQPGEATH